MPQQSSSEKLSIDRLVMGIASNEFAAFDELKVGVGAKPLKRDRLGCKSTSMRGECKACSPKLRAERRSPSAEGTRGDRRGEESSHLGETSSLANAVR